MIYTLSVRRRQPHNTIQPIDRKKGKGKRVEYYSRDRKEKKRKKKKKCLFKLKAFDITMSTYIS